MKQTDFRHFLAAIPRLSSQQTAFLVNKLTDPCSDILAKLASDIDQHHQCVLCHSDKIKKNGKINQRQRYKCHACGKTFMCTRGSAFFYQHKSELWQDYLETMNAGDTLRSSAKKLGISLTSAFKWRHRYMASTTDEYYLSEQNHKLEGIVEADETFFRYSEKGTKQLTGSPRKRGTKASTRGINKNDWVTVLVAMDRNKHEFDHILTGVNTAQIEQFLAPKLSKDVTLCTDGSPVYPAFCQHQHLNHVVLKDQRVLQHCFHIQNVNNYHQQIKDKYRRMRGVASKYLERYLGWFRMLHWHKYQQIENPLDFKLLALQHHKCFT